MAKFALLSVSDKRGLVEFATALALGEKRLTHLALPALFCTALFWLIFR